MGKQLLKRKKEERQVILTFTAVFLTEASEKENQILEEFQA